MSSTPKLFGGNKECEARFLKSALKASKAAMDQVVKGEVNNQDKRGLAEKMLSAAIAASAIVYVQTVTAQQQEEENKQEKKEATFSSASNLWKVPDSTGKSPDSCYTSPSPGDAVISTDGLAENQRNLKITEK